MGAGSWINFSPWLWPMNSKESKLLFYSMYRKKKVSIVVKRITVNPLMHVNKAIPFLARTS